MSRESRERDDEQRERRRRSRLLCLVVTAGLTVLIGIPGLVALIWPYFSWYITEGWRYENVEPSGLTLILGRVGGVFLLLVYTVSLLYLYIRYWDD